MNIGEAAQASGVSAKMIRYYESTGMVAPAARTRSNYRVYSPSDIHSLRFIKRARTLGFSMEKTGALLALWHDKTRASSAVKSFATGHIAELEEKIGEMEAMVRTLKHLAGHCHGDARPDCPILDDLSGHQTRRPG